MKIYYKAKLYAEDQLITQFEHSRKQESEMPFWLPKKENI